MQLYKQREKILFNKSQENHWKMLHSVGPEQSLADLYPKPRTSSLRASQTHTTNMRALMSCSFNLHLRSVSLLLTMAVLIPMSSLSHPIHLQRVLWHPQHQMDEPLKELMKDPSPGEEGQYAAQHGENCSELPLSMSISALI